MIRALVLDIDGVLVGEKIGFNTPDPNQQVLERLTVIRSTGIPIVLCTAKPHYSIRSIINAAKLINPHITLAGGIIIDPLNDTLVESHPFSKQTAIRLMEACVRNNFYTEVYTRDTYYVQRSHIYDLTKIHTHILQHEPEIVSEFNQIMTEDIYKILPIVSDESGMAVVDQAFLPFKQDIEVTWSIHPIANPHQFCNIAPAGTSKRLATLNVLKHLGLEVADTLSVGDSTSDWKFMELTGYAATLENGQESLKRLVASRGDRGFTGGHVDKNGILSILDHFRL